MFRIFFFLLRVALAIILLQTLFYKFSGHPDSVYIFTTVGLEPYGRIGIGVLELIASVLLLIPRASWIGATLSAGILSGAIFFHLTKLGIEINGDHGLLFGLAIISFIMSLIILGVTIRQRTMLRS